MHDLSRRIGEGINGLLAGWRLGLSRLPVVPMVVMVVAVPTVRMVVAPVAIAMVTVGTVVVAASTALSFPHLFLLVLALGDERACSSVLVSRDGRDKTD